MRLRTRAEGFTLIELLIVIAIIALLISILLPALQAARNEGSKAVCMHSLQQIMAGNSMYDNDNGDNRTIPWYFLRPRGDGPTATMQAAYTSGEGMYADPGTVTPWVFGGNRAPQPGGFSDADSTIYPANFRLLNRYIEPTAHCREDDGNDRGRDIIKIYQCPGDRSWSVRRIGGESETIGTQENSIPAHAANGSSFTLNSRWMQGYYGFDFNGALNTRRSYEEALSRIARGTVGGAASRFVQWCELGMYSATHNAAEKPEWGSAAPQRVGWHRKFSTWSVCFADGHADHGYFDTRQIYGLNGTIWQPDFYVGHSPP
ncbi:MAG TPA: prepilin-type N-terminal cleavage/methylation domain-containing protein [Phycisphaerae bacterium]|nr:prepilin-type N-terminal cleavage/methylation domain-containing protein [Phycisphaerae bacterium]